MKLLGRVLAVIGAIFVLALAVFAFLASSASAFKDEHQAFVREFATEFCRTWDPATVEASMSNQLLSELATPDGVQTLALFRPLGALEDLTDMELANYISGTDGKTGVFRFKGAFENGRGVVTVSVNESDEAVRVIGFHISITGQGDGANRRHRA